VVDVATAGRVVGAVLSWYERSARDLPWRHADATPWQILVSEVMLQQTPVSRVLDPWRAWVQRWPRPAALAAEASGEAVRAWGRLGYPRRALRLHAAADRIVVEHGGEVPSGMTALRALPGVGGYTAAAVASFAFGQRHAVLDTNVRRVLARLAAGAARPGPSLTVAEQRTAELFLPADPRRAARWGAASMELGATICMARTPRCDACPVQRWCAWRRAGQPASAGAPRRRQSYAGTDRQCRGALLGAVRAAAEPLAATVLAEAWPGLDQRRRALASLLADGLLVETDDLAYRLP
jgi:A/G-specific adenine glycosylase